MNYSYSIPGNKIDGAISALEKSIGNTVLNVQKVAVSILADLKLHGDKPTAANRANALVKALGKGMRGNSMKAWFENHAPLVWNDQEKKLVAGFFPASPVKDHAKIDLEVCKTDLWQLEVKDPEYKGIADWDKLLQGIISRAKTDLEKLGDKSKVNKEQLAVIEKLVA